MSVSRKVFASLAFFGFGLFLGACASPNPQPAALTPIPTLGPGATITLVPALQTIPATAPAPALSAMGEAEAALGAPFYLVDCATCHGNEGQGVDAPALRNSQFIQSGDPQDIYTTIANGRAGTQMPAWLQANGGPLGDTQIQWVIAYLKTLQGVPPIPPATPAPEEPTPTAEAGGGPTPEPAHPSNPGEPGPAVALSGDPERGKGEFGLYCAACHGPQGVQGIPNPGSSDGGVPLLNPIDPTIASPDPNVFATNVDLFIEHGSIPEGPAPQIIMPPFGDSKLLSSQQIADLIAYILEINSRK